MNTRRQVLKNYSCVLLVFSLMAAFIVALFWGEPKGMAFWLGSMVMLLPQLFFVYRTYGSSAAVTPQRAVFVLMRAESGKFLLVSAAFALLFGYHPELPALPVFAGVIFMLVVQIAANVGLTNRLAGPNVRHNDRSNENS